MHTLAANKAEYVLLVCKVCPYVVSSALVSVAECQALGCAVLGANYLVSSPIY